LYFWGCTVITNLLSTVPGLVPWICGGFFVSNPSLSRFYIFHFLLPFIIYILIFIHIFYLHQVSSNNPLGYNINNKITFFPFFISKDLFSFFNIGFFSILEIFFNLISLSHPDNIFEVNILVTPLHIVPEWYFLEFYMILKAIPNKNAGFMIMFSSIFYIFIQSEPKGINLISLLFIGHISILFIFLIIFYFL
jgi:quinol-cytochrome oxidoreductase complex cytochrome b subunit